MSRKEYKLGARGGVFGWGAMQQAWRSRVRVPMRWTFFNLPNPSSRTMALGSTQSCKKSYCSVFSILLLISSSEVQIFYSSSCPQRSLIYTRNKKFWEELIACFPFTTFEYLIRDAVKTCYVCVMKSVKQWSLWGCSFGVTDQRDLWSSPLRRHEAAWYTYQISWRSVQACK
jgi:hypothetical protein